MTARARALLGAGVGAVAAVITLGPALAPGYLLFYDMVFVPRLAMNARTLGIDGSVPRAVPSDLVVAVLSRAAPGWVVQKLVLLAVFVLVGAGVAVLTRDRLQAGAAALAAVWNPYLGERLAIGHWPYLVAYALLPWVAVAAGRVRRGRAHGLPQLLAVMIVVSLTGSTGAVFAAVLAGAVLLVPAAGLRRPRPGVLLATFAVTVLANTTWLYPYLALAPHESGDPAGVDAFMARADTPYGTVASLLTGGGIWNQGVWFADRRSAVLAGVALLAVLGALAAWARSLCRAADPAGRGVAVAGVVGLLLAALSALPGGHAVMVAIVTDLPGGGLLRDSQKFIALWWVAVSLAVGHASGLVWRYGARLGAARLVRIVATLAVACWPVVTLPGLAWGAAGRWQAVQYPSDVLRAADWLDAAPAGGVAVFPWTLYRRYPWDGDRVLLDPWQRLLAKPVLVNDDLPLGTITVRGESPQAQQVTASIQRGGDVAGVLRSLGVRWVLINTDQPAVERVPAFSGARTVFQRPGVRVLDLGAVSHSLQRPSLADGAGYLGPAVAVAIVVITEITARRRVPLL